MNHDPPIGNAPPAGHAAEPLAAIIDGLYHCHQLDISAYDESFVSKAVAKRMSIHGLTDISAYASYLPANHDEAIAFHRSLRVAYSGFFRNSLTFALLEQSVLPNLLARQKKSGTGEIRVWSAGCASGQEPWS